MKPTFKKMSRTAKTEGEQDNLDRKKLINRLNRTEGQIRGITKMIEEERDCSEVVTQLAAVKAGVDKVISIIVTENLLGCVLKEGEEINKKKLEDALELIFKIR